jgi:ribosomal protein S18 acetylase RimI-like enzyme
MSRFRVRPLRPGDGPAAVEIEALSYPYLDSEHRLGRTDVLVHCRVFPEGAFAAVDADDRLWGMALGWRVEFDLEHPAHTLDDVAEASSHVPDGAWYYGLDITVHPEQRGQGLGHLMYEARRSLVRREAMRGILAGGMIPGYRAVMHEVDPSTYVADVVAGRRSDPTLSFQLREGFEVRGLLPGYVSGTAGDGIATFLVWENPDHPESG